jgi:hypothetical protein
VVRVVAMIVVVVVVVVVVVTAWHLSIDKHLDHWNEYLIMSARQVFGKPSDKPRKPWISARSWCLIRHIAPMRRMLHVVSSCRHRLKLKLAWLAWVSMLAAPFPCHCVAIPRGWIACALHAETCSSLRRVNLLEAMLFLTITRAQHVITVLVVDDRQVFLQRMAAEAQVAAWNGDARSCFAVVRALAGAGSQVAKVVKLKDGALSQSDEQRQARWQEHFSDVFKGSVVERAQLHGKSQSNTVQQHNFHTSPDKNKACDCLAGEE